MALQALVLCRRDHTVRMMVYLLYYRKNAHASTRGRKSILVRSLKDLLLAPLTKHGQAVILPLAGIPYLVLISGMATCFKTFRGTVTSQV